MICKSGFRLNRDGTPSKFCFCKTPELIENYDKAMTDTAQTWQCHHRLETHTSEGERRLVHLSVEELKALDMYYNRPAEELIYLTKSEHQKLHHTGRPGPNMGKHFSEEHIRKIAEANKGKKHFKGIYCIDLCSEDNKLIKEEVIKGFSTKDLFEGLVKAVGDSTQLDCSSAVVFRKKFRKGRDVKLTNKYTKEVLYARIRELKNL